MLQNKLLGWKNTTSSEKLIRQMVLFFYLQISTSRIQEWWKECFFTLIAKFYHKVTTNSVVKCWGAEKKWKREKYYQCIKQGKPKQSFSYTMISAWVWKLSTIMGISLYTILLEKESYHGHFIINVPSCAWSFF